MFHIVKQEACNNSCPGYLKDFVLLCYSQVPEWKERETINVFIAEIWLQNTIKDQKGGRGSTFKSKWVIASDHTESLHFRSFKSNIQGKNKQLKIKIYIHCVPRKSLCLMLFFFFKSDIYVSLFKHQFRRFQG